MTRQAKIREGVVSKIGDKLHDHAYYREWDDRATCDLISKANAIASSVLSYLDENSVVIKVDKELPKHLFFMRCRGSDMAYEQYALQDSCIKAGYVAVEPLL